MESIIVTQVKNPKDTNFVLEFIRRFGTVRVLKGKSMEKFYLSKMLDEAMHSENIPIEQVHRELRK